MYAAQLGVRYWERNLLLGSGNMVGDEVHLCRSPEEVDRHLIQFVTELINPCYWLVAFLCCVHVVSPRPILILA